jgi:hypothetical protein
MDPDPDRQHCVPYSVSVFAMKRYELNICFRDDTVRTEHSVWRPDPGTRPSDFGTSQQRHRCTSARQRILSLVLLGLIHYCCIIRLKDREKFEKKSKI